MFVTISALALGFLHGLGADHLMAIAALSVRPHGSRAQAASPVRVALGFAVGHALLLLAGSAGVLVLGWQIPVLVERAGELVGGSVLVALGAFTVWVVVADRLYGHSHAHGHPPHTHFHLHFGRRGRHGADTAHTHAPGLLGAVFAVSGLRALTLLAPLGGATAGAADSMLRLFCLVSVFAIGILLSMSIFGIVLSRMLGSRWVAGVGRSVELLTGVASIGLGAYWILTVA